MPLNLEVFKVRAISSVVFVCIMLTGLLWSPWSFLVLFLIIHTGCWWEYILLVEKIEKIEVTPLTRLGLICTGTGIMLLFCSPFFQIAQYPLRENLFLPVSLAGFVLIAIGVFQKQSNLTLRGFGTLLLGWVYLSLFWGMMISLRQYGMSSMLGDMGRLLPILLIVSIWINDTMAYVVGSFIGKTPLSSISPKKTWEGTIGGAILAILVVSFLARYAFGTDWLHAISIPAIGAIAGTLGDLLESKIKRLAGVKDSGKMMPGHGGFLDRFDSMLIATPVAWTFIQIFG